MTGRPPKPEEKRIRIIVRVEYYPENGGAKTGESSLAYHTISAVGASMLIDAIARWLPRLGARRTRVVRGREDEDVWTDKPDRWWQRPRPAEPLPQLSLEHTASGRKPMARPPATAVVPTKPIPPPPPRPTPPK
jgi:hypothetical protein